MSTNILTTPQALRRAETAEDHALRDFQHSLYAIIFLGTPHRGSGYAPVGEVVRRIVAATGLDTSNRNLRTLHYDSPELESSREEFSRQWRQGRFIVKTFQEARGFKSLQGLNDKIVPDFSSSLDDPRENAEHIDANHMEMCRFTGMSDNGYIQVGGELASMTRNIRIRQDNPRKAPVLETEIERSLSGDEQACLQSLSFPEMDSRYHSISRALDGTCEWLLQRPEYNHWRDKKSAMKQNGFLWIKGKPGAGKSTMMKMIVNDVLDQVSNEKPIIIRFFFNTQGSSNLETTMLGLLRSLICQLLLQNRYLFRKVLPLYRRKLDTHGHNWNWYVQELKDCLLDMYLEGRANSIYVIIDALDECIEMESRDTVTLLQDLLSSSTATAPVKICLSGRHYPIINVDDCLEIQIDRYNMSDIQTYLDRWLQPHDASPGLSLLVSEIMKKASGIFLWVVLVVKTLVKARDEGYTRSHMLEIVHDLPKQLNDLITQIVRSIDSDASGDAIRILQWVTFSSRPMSTIELRYALEAGRSIRLDSQEQLLSSPTFLDSDSQLEKVIRARTKGLTEVKRYGIGIVAPEIQSAEVPERVQFIHGSIKDFMVDHHGFQILDRSLAEGTVEKSHLELAKSCINYLGCEEIRRALTAIPEAGLMTQLEAAKTLAALYQTYPFLEYTIESIMEHIEKVQTGGSSVALYHDLMTSTRSVYGLWRQLADLNLARNFNELRGPDTSFAHIVAEFGIPSWVMELVHNGFDINGTGGRYHTLLEAASVKGHASLVKQLLDSGADVDIEGGRYGNALSAAATSGNAEVLQAILDKKPDVNAIAGEYGTALQAAAQVSPENEELVAKLLAAKADVSIYGGVFGDALQASAYTGNKKILIRLIEAGAQIDLQGGKFGSALQAAASQGHTEIVTILLGKGADPYLQGGDCGSALWVAATGGHTDIVRHLIALDLASSNHSKSGHAEALDFSEELERRIEDTMEAGRDSSRFHGAVDQGDTATIEEMLAKRVDVNVRGGEFSTAWHTAAFLGHNDAMSILLAQPSGNPDLKDSAGRTALWFAASEGHVAVVRQLLMTRVVDTTVRSVSGRNVLWWPCSRGFVDVVDLLLRAGVDPHEEDEDGDSPMATAKEEGHVVVLKLLMQVNEEEKNP